jgi:hypothetical protein
VCKNNKICRCRRKLCEVKVGKVLTYGHCLPQTSILRNTILQFVDIARRLSLIRTKLNKSYGTWTKSVQNLEN